MTWIKIGKPRSRQNVLRDNHKFEVKHMYKGKLKARNGNEEQMGNKLIKENYEKSALDELLLNN